jgi:hypothetical protein
VSALIAHPAVDALIGVDDEHVLALVEAVDGAHRDAIGGLALDVFFIDDVGHGPFHMQTGPSGRWAGVTCIAFGCTVLNFRQTGP